MRTGWFGPALGLTLLSVARVWATAAEPTAPASEADPATPAAGHSIHGEAFDDGPRQAGSLLPGMGTTHFPVTSGCDSAKSFCNQGVAQLHSFYYFEAERSFRQAAKLDPACAMAYWGLAMANVNNPRRARPFLKDARDRAAGASRRETLYLDALDALYAEGGTETTRKQNHLLGWETLVQEFPDDPDARAWLAMTAWQNGATGSRQSVDVVLDSVQALGPTHPGAHHYRIHLWDGAKPARAEKAAAAYGPAAAGVAHAWHMPGHTYTGLKRYADAAYQQEASARVDHSAMARDRIMPFEIHNYAHNNQWLATSLSHVGRAREAVRVARNLVDQPRDPAKNRKDDGGSAQRSGRLRWSEVLCRYELWDDLIAATKTGDLDWSDVPAERKQKAYALGLAYAGKADAVNLASQIGALKTLGDEDAKAKRGSTVETALAELQGHERLLKGDVGPAFERFAKATEMRPESLARAHLSARNYGSAEAVARSAVSTQPGQVPPLAALVEVLHACGKTADAQTAYRQLTTLGRRADLDTPVFRRLAAVVAAWKAESGWVAPPETATDDVAAGRVDLTTLGPLDWTPTAAEALSGIDSAAATWDLATHRGRNVVVLFFLGGKCPHCLQQLQAFAKEYEALKASGTDVVAVSTDDPAAVGTLKENREGVAFPMPILADPTHEAFRRYRSYDDFEDRPLHGIYLIDAAGGVRFRRVSAEPFLDTDFIKAEAARVSRLLRPASPARP